MSGLIVTSVSSLFTPLQRSRSMFSGGFLTPDSGRERLAPAIIKTLITASETGEQPEGTDTQEGEEGRGGGSEPGTCYWRLTCPIRMQYSAGGRGRDPDRWEGGENR